MTEKPKFSPRTVSDVEMMFVASRTIRKATVRQFMESAMGSDQVDELGKAAVMRWYRGRIYG